jgi:predicted membrane protein
MKNDIVKDDIGGKSIPSQVFLGLGVIGLGVLFLLDNLGYIEFRDTVRYWPALVVLWGGAKLLDAKSPHERLTFGVITAIGALLLLNRMGLGFINARMLWPVILIVVGALVVYKAMIGRRTMGTVMKVDEDAGNIVDVTAILGGFERRITTPTFRGGEITAIMGGCELDLRGSSIEGDAVLNVFAVMGGITIKCPPDWTVVLQGTPIMGGFDEKTITPPNGAKRLVIKGYAIMGGVEVRN